MWIIQVNGITPIIIIISKQRPGSVVLVSHLRDFKQGSFLASKLNIRQETNQGKSKLGSQSML